MKKIGLLIPSTNLTVENELQLLYEKNTISTDNVCFYTSKLEYKTSYKEDKEKFLEELADNSILKSKELEYLNVDYYAFFCTSSAIINSTKNIANSPAEAIIEVARRIDIKKCLLITPYNDKLGEEIKRYLENEKIEVARNINLDLINTKDYFEYGKKQLEALIVDNYKDEYESIIISCTNLPTIHLISKLEKQLKTNIISSNSCLFWKIINENEIKTNYNIFGNLGGVENE